MEAGFYIAELNPPKSSLKGGLGNVESLSFEKFFGIEGLSTFNGNVQQTGSISGKTKILDPVRAIHVAGTFCGRGESELDKL